MYSKSKSQWSIKTAQWKRGITSLNPSGRPVNIAECPQCQEAWAFRPSQEMGVSCSPFHHRAAECGRWPLPLNPGPPSSPQGDVLTRIDTHRSQVGTASSLGWLIDLIPSHKSGFLLGVLEIHKSNWKFLGSNQFNHIFGIKKFKRLPD